MYIVTEIPSVLCIQQFVDRRYSRDKFCNIDESWNENPNPSGVSSFRSGMISTASFTPVWMHIRRMESLRSFQPTTQLLTPIVKPPRLDNDQDSVISMSNESTECLRYVLEMKFIRHTPIFGPIESMPFVRSCYLDFSQNFLFCIKLAFKKLIRP